MADKLTDPERSFYELCYDQYTREKDETEGIYRRAGILLTALPILGAVTYGLGRTDLVPRLFTRVDVFLYYLAVLAAWLALATSVFFLVRSILLRTYSSLAPMKKWHGWIEEYRRKFPNEGKDLSDEDKSVIGAELIRSLIPLLADAQTHCSENNEHRRKLLKTAFSAAAIAIACIAGEAVFHVILHLQDVNP